MGRIKSGMIRKAASQLAESVEGFSGDFENNKKLLKGTVPYKSMRNKLAGQLVRLAKENKKNERRDNRKEGTTD